MAKKLKEMYLTRSSIKAFAGVLSGVDRGFDSEKFTRLVLDEGFEAKELMARMRHATECLHDVLPKPYKKALGVLRKAAPKAKGMEQLCLPDYVSLYGLEDWDISLDALALFTKYSSSEFGIRPFIVKNPKRAMSFMKKVAGDSDENVRRFASEGCRPRLPWGTAIQAFKKDPAPILPVLEKLKDDESEFVRRSVANNLNDISKDNPDVVLKLCRKWIGKSERTDWILKHACRGMMKAGDSRALALFGFREPRNLEVDKLKLDKRRLSIGEKVQLEFVLRVKGRVECRVRLEYVVNFARASGADAKKVFKIGEKTYGPGAHVIKKTHSFADQSTRKHHPGPHKIAVVVNGVEKARASLTLTK
jgi:3-methyladenine DNA glycosylase AlkC